MGPGIDGDEAMSDKDQTVNLGHDAGEGRSLGAIARALAAGKSLADVDIDLSDPEKSRFGAYTLVERIGAGGMGLVFRAHQHSLERDVAIKILNMHLTEEGEALARFRFEAKSAAALNHPNIVQVLEVGQVDGVAFIAMQLIRGETLEQRIQRQRLSPAAAVALMLKLCDAVGYAHRLQLLHLDLKPANVLIDERGEPMVADFGLARHMNSQGEVEAQEVSGSPGYMAPEQVLIKEFRLSVATDIYALGAILYELLCGQPPHGRGAAYDVMQRALAGGVPGPRSLAPSAPKDLEAICMKCLRMRASDRYPDAAAMAEDLRCYANNLPVSVRSPTALERVHRWYAREPKFAAALVTLLVVAVGGSFVLANMYRNAERERKGAEGLVQVLMSQTPTKANAVLPKIASFNVPVIGCTGGKADCGLGVDVGTSGDASLPVSQKQRYLESLRRYVPRIATWGNPRLSAQLAQTLDDVQDELYEPRRAEAAAAIGTTDGFLFAYLFARNGVQTNLDRKTINGWFDSALAKADQPWQAQMLAQSCGQTRPACVAAVERFRALDPDNAAAWMMGMPADPSDEADRNLLRAANAQRLDHHAGAFLDAATAFGIRLMPTMAPELRVTPPEFAHDVWIEAGPFDFPTDYCRHAFTDRDVTNIQDACRKLFAKVDASMQPSLLDEIVAASIEKKMPGSASAQVQAWIRLQDARWIYAVWRQLPPTAESDEAAQVQAIRAQGELAYVKSLVTAAHMPIEAPRSFVTKEPSPWKRRAVADGASKSKDSGQ
jgi:serine/threonine protein kinase